MSVRRLLFSVVLVLLMLSGCKEKAPEIVVTNNEKSKVTPLIKEKEPHFDEYEVVAGDTFSKIARKFNVTEEKLKEWNQEVVPEALVAGQSLQLISPILQYLGKEEVVFQEGFTYQALSDEMI